MALPIIIGVAAIAAGAYIYDKFYGDSDEERAAKEKKLYDEVSNEAVEIISKYSITCRCKGWALPILDTNNRYCCLKCNSKFANAYHNINKHLETRLNLSEYSFSYYKPERSIAANGIKILSEQLKH